MATIIIKNNSGSEQTIEDLNWLTIPNGEQVTASDLLPVSQIYFSQDLKTLVNAGDLVINNGSSDLSIADAQTFLEEFNNTEQKNYTLSVVEAATGAANELDEILANGNSAGSYDINMNGNDITNINVLQNVSTSNITITASNGKQVRLNSSSDIITQLGDMGGVNFLDVENSGDGVCFKVWSNGQVAINAGSMTGSENFKVNGGSLLDGQINVTGDSTFQNDLVVQGDMYIQGTEYVSQTEIISGDQLITGNISVSGSYLDMYAQTVTVAKDGADFTLIQSAIDSITDATTNKRYAILVYPGDYAENITMKSYVDLVGISDAETCRLTPTTGVIITFDSTYSNIYKLGIDTNYGTLTANQNAVVIINGEHELSQCQFNVQKSGGNFSLTGLDVSGGITILNNCKFVYDVSAGAGLSILQTPISVSGTSTTFHLNNCDILSTNNDTNDLLAGIATSASGTSDFRINNSTFELTNNGNGITAGLYASGTSNGGSICYNEWMISSVNDCYVGYLTGSSATFFTHHNHIVGTSSGGTSYAGNLAAGNNWDSHFDILEIDQSVIGAGTFTYINAPANIGDLKVSRSISLNPQTSNPSPADAGMMFVRDDILWLADTSRTKFLSVQEMWVGAGRNSVTQAVGYLRGFNGSIQSATLGYTMPRDGTIIAMSVSRTDTDSVTWQVHADGVYLTGATITTTATNDYVDNLNVDFSAGDNLAIYQSAGTSSYPNVTVWYKWRI